MLYRKAGIEKQEFRKESSGEIIKIRPISVRLVGSDIEGRFNRRRQSVVINL
jgi:hypothetical protein